MFSPRTNNGDTSTLQVESDPVHVCDQETPVELQASDNARPSLSSPVSVATIVVDEVKSPYSSVLKRTPGSTFASALRIGDNKDTKTEYGGPYLEDLENFRVTYGSHIPLFLLVLMFSCSVLPTKCEVTKEELQDEMLKGDYGNLPCLMYAFFRMRRLSN